MWDSSVEQKLNCIDRKTNSKLLITSRIRGLHADAKEVQLSLLTAPEAVAMLTSVAGLDCGSEVGVSTEVMKLVALSGRLPLTVGVIGGMLRDCGGGTR